MSVFQMYTFFLYLILMSICIVHCNVTSTCGQKEMCNSYLDLAIDMIVRAKYNIPTCPKFCMPSKTTFDGPQPSDCTDVIQMGYNKSGIYKIWPMNRVTDGKSLRVYCDMDTDGGGWTVIQGRGDFGSTEDYFYQNWESYKDGFGDVEKDFWLGNDNIFALTNQKLYSARFDLTDFQQNASYALYEKFWIDEECYKYRLHISIYSGNAGDSMTYQNNQTFSTHDQDNDDYEDNCPAKRKGAWWYKACAHSNLNGFYLKGKIDETGVYWKKWKSSYESLLSTEIKIRPKSYNPSFESKIIPY